MYDTNRARHLLKLVSDTNFVNFIITKIMSKRIRILGTGCNFRSIVNNATATRIKRQSGKDYPIVQLVVKRSGNTVNFFSGPVAWKPDIVANSGIIGQQNYLNHPVIGFLISVEDYIGNQSVELRNHAISAVKVGPFLYGFNSWGNSISEYQAFDRRIFEKIAQRYNCILFYVYSGPNLQPTNDPVCVSFAADFVLFMFEKISQGVSQVPYIYKLNNQNVHRRLQVSRIFPGTTLPNRARRLANTGSVRALGLITRTRTMLPFLRRKVSHKIVPVSMNINNESIPMNVNIGLLRNRKRSKTKKPKNFLRIPTGRRAGKSR